MDHPYDGRGFMYLRPQNQPPPKPNAVCDAIASFFDLTFQPDKSVDQLAKGAHAILDALPTGIVTADRTKVVGSINGMFDRMDRLGQEKLVELKEQARIETLKDLKGSSESILWIEPDEFDQSTFILDEKVGCALDSLAGQLARRETYVAKGIRAPTRLLFAGGPGTGKTMGAQWLAAKLGMPIGIVRADEMGSQFMAMTAKNLSAVIKSAEQKGGILFLDEVDGLFMSREAIGSGGVGEEFKRITTSFLQILNNQPRAQIIICATNLPSKLDPAMLRRFPNVIAFTPPDAEARRKIAATVLNKMAITDDALTHLVSRTNGASGDHVTNIAHAAASYAIDQGDDLPIQEGHIRRALAAIPQPPSMGEHQTHMLT